jgi:hypothetical protein
MKNTMVYDFRLYNQALPVDSITKWAAIVPDLDNETLYGETGDFTELNALISQYSNAISQWAVGDGIGQYPQAAIDEFTDAVAVAQTLVNENKASQYLIDIQVTDLKAAFSKLEAAIGDVIVHPESAGETDYPFESGLYYIEIGDYYLTMPEEGVVNTFTELRRYIDNEEKLHNNQVWNIQYNPVYSDLTLETPRALYSFVSGKTVWEEDGAWHLDEVGRMKEGNTGVTQSETGSNWDWREHRIYFNGTAYSLVNNHTNNAIVFAGETENELPQSLAAKKFNFKFRTIDDVVADPKLPNAIQNPTVGNNAKIYVSNGEIVVSNIETGSLITVYNISGRLVKTVKASTYVNRLPLASGLYIVKIAGQTPLTAKVIIR